MKRMSIKELRERRHLVASEPKKEEIKQEPKKEEIKEEPKDKPAKAPKGKKFLVAEEDNPTKDN